jgi:hypothetical protein
MYLEEAQLAAYLDGELSEPERALVEQRLAVSPQLRARLNQLREETDLMSRALDALSPRRAMASAASALKQIYAQLPATEQAVSSPPIAHVGPTSPLIWESPPLWAEIKTGLKHHLSSPRTGLVAMAGVFLVSIIAVGVIWLFRSGAYPAMPTNPVESGPIGGAVPQASPTPTPPPLQRGIQADPRGDTQANIGHIKKLGLGWVKLQMSWKDVEPKQGAYDWTAWDATIGAYAADGIKVMLSIPKAPDWARPAEDDKSVEGPPADPATYAHFVGLVASRYQGKVQAIEIWNEQNLWYEAGGRGRVSAISYVGLLQAAYRAIKDANHDMAVISGGLTPAGNMADMAVDDIEYLQQMYAAGAKGYFDALGAHPAGYNCPALADWRTFEDPTATFRAPFEQRHHSWCFLGTMEPYREVMVANGDAEKTIWVTEFGWAVSSAAQPQGYEFAGDNTPEERAQWIVQAYQWGEKQPWVGPMFLFNLDFSLTMAQTELATFSILEPTYDALLELNKSNSEPK